MSTSLPYMLPVPRTCHALSPAPIIRRFFSGLVARAPPTSFFTLLLARRGLLDAPPARSAGHNHARHIVYPLGPLLVTELLLGLSPTIHSIDQIKVVDRFRGLLPPIRPSDCAGPTSPLDLRCVPLTDHGLHLCTEIPHEGAMADLVWSDPDSEKEDFAISPRYV
ncbi:unnamed protein product [Rhizoctonia solani]|uniref:Uncharacterized protein n=1 Tax=Rhizoctonia solani TaxID=456999 RepID=A0A8H3A8I6_9AGAM|nr:unnamed protein product [Rhizoctonia solani]